MQGIKASAKTVMFDVDGTLIDAAQNPIASQVNRYRKLQKEGKTVGVWSRRGPGYARKIANKLGLTVDRDGVKGAFKPDIAYDNEESGMGKKTVKVGIAHGQVQRGK